MGEKEKVILKAMYDECQKENCNWDNIHNTIGFSGNEVALLISNLQQDGYIEGVIFTGGEDEPMVALLNGGSLTDKGKEFIEKGM